MNYGSGPIDNMVGDIKGTTKFLAKVIFAGFNIVFLVVIGLIIAANFGVM
jgi:hypothetical protein